MQPNQNGFGRVVSEVALGFRDLAPHDHSSREAVGFSLGDLSVALLPGQQEGRPPVMGLDLPKVDSLGARPASPRLLQCRPRLRARSMRGAVPRGEWN